MQCMGDFLMAESLNVSSGMDTLTIKQLLGKIIQIKKMKMKTGVDLKISASGLKNITKNDKEKIKR